MLFIFSIILALCGGCSPQSQDNLNEALKLYRQNKLDKALVYFEREVKQNKNNADAFAWLAETYRRLGQHQKAADAAWKALALNSNHSFAHTVLSDAYNPQYSSWKKTNYDTTWQHLLLAIESDPNDGNACLSLWIEAMRRGEDVYWKKALHSMVITKFLTPSVMAYNRWVLYNLPSNAILFTNGDMDTYPAVALQVVEGFRTDVAIVNTSLLNLPWYARFINRQYNVPLPFQDSELDLLKPKRGPHKTVLTPSNQIIRGWFKQKEDNRLSRSIAIASTVDLKSLPSNIEYHLKMAGPFFLWFPLRVDNPNDIALMKMNIENIHPLDFKGPYVAPEDHSPIRITSAVGLSGCVVRIVLDYAQILIDAKRFTEASNALDLAENIDKNYVSGRIFTKEISKLRKTIIN
jgi:tetratricopeptide (TPR) repeat protein